MTAPYQPPHTFRTMQQQGYARPGPQMAYYGGTEQMQAQGENDDQAGGTRQPQPYRPPAPSPYPRQPSPQRPPEPGQPQGGSLPVPMAPPIMAPQGGPDIVGELGSQWRGYQPYQGFSFQGANFPAYQPGQFNGVGQYQSAPQGYQAIGGPQMREQGSFQQGTNPVAQALESSVLGGLQNPSAYGDANILSQYDTINRRMGQDFDVERQRIDEDSARRGIYFSSIPQGRLGDVAVRQAQAQGDVASNLLNQSAARSAQDRQAAIASALGVNQAAFGNQLAGYNANLAGNAQNFQQDLATRAFQGDQQAQQVLSAMNNAQFNAGENQRQFGNQATAFGLNQQAGQQGFQNQMGLNQQNFNQGLAGYQANLGAGNQSFNERQQLLGNYLGAGQQQFNNQLSTAQFNAQQDQYLQQLLQSLLGAGAA